MNTLIRRLTMLLTVLVVVACSGGVVLEPTDPPVVEARIVAQAAKIDSDVAGLNGGNSAEVALSASELFFESAQVVVLASVTEPEALPRAASAAITLGAPLLLTAAEGENLAGENLSTQSNRGGESGSLNTELLRLGTRALITVGDVSLHQIDVTSLVVKPLPEDGEELEELLGAPITEIPEPVLADAAHELEKLEVGHLYESTELGEGPSDYGRVPETLPPRRNSKTIVWAENSSKHYAGIATARAAGAQVFVDDDPGESVQTVDYAHAHVTHSVVGIGDDLSEQKRLQRLANTIRRGALLPTGAQRVFSVDGDRVRLVTVDGIQMMKKADIDDAEDVFESSLRLAEEFGNKIDNPTISGVEIDPANVRQKDLNYWLHQSSEQNQYLLLSFKVGSDLPSLLEQYDEILRHPHVGVHIATRDDEKVSASDLNEAIVGLRQIVREGQLPQKPLIVDLEDSGKIGDPEHLATSGFEVAVSVRVKSRAKPWKELVSDFPQDVFLGLNTPLRVPDENKPIRLGKTSDQVDDPRVRVLHIG